MLVLFVACGKSDDGPRTDWSRVALDNTIESTVNNVSFTITLPKGWKRDVDEPLLKGWQPGVKDYAQAPSVTVGYVQQPPTDLDAYVKTLTFEGGTPIVAKKIMNTDRLAVVTHTATHSVVKVDTVIHKGETYLGCSAFQMRDGGVPSPKATIEWLEKLCATLTIK